MGIQLLNFSIPPHDSSAFISFGVSRHGCISLFDCFLRHSDLPTVFSLETLGDLLSCVFLLRGCVASTINCLRIGVQKETDKQANKQHALNAEGKRFINSMDDTDEKEGRRARTNPKHKV